jgi:hypothetical protein
MLDLESVRDDIHRALGECEVVLMDVAADVVEFRAVVNIRRSSASEIGEVDLPLGKAIVQHQCAVRTLPVAGNEIEGQTCRDVVCQRIAKMIIVCAEFIRCQVFAFDICLRKHAEPLIEEPRFDASDDFVVVVFVIGV